MPIKEIQIGQAGMSGTVPSFCYIETTDTVAQVTTAGYLTSSVQAGFSFSDTMLAVVSTKATQSALTSAVGIYGIANVSGVWSLIDEAGPGDVILPTIANHLMVSTNTTGVLANLTGTAINDGSIQAGRSTIAGTFISFPSSAANGVLILAAANAGGAFNTTISNGTTGQSQVISIPDSGATTANFIISKFATTQTITSGALQVTAGALISGISTGGFVGLVKAFPTTGSKGFVAMQAAVNATGDFGTTISNATAQAQAQVVTVPDAGAATANFLLDTGAANIIAKQQFIGLQSVLNYSAGTWTRTRLAQGDYGQVKTQGNDTTIIGIDITPQIVVAASKGFRLDSFDVIYSIATLALDAHSLTLDRIAYANNVAVSVTSITGTYTLATATQANPYLTNCTVTTPAFDVTADSKYVIEVTVDAGATSDYTWYGIMLRFSQTIG